MILVGWSKEAVRDLKFKRNNGQNGCAMPARSNGVQVCPCGLSNITKIGPLLLGLGGVQNCHHSSFINSHVDSQCQSRKERFIKSCKKRPKSIPTKDLLNSNLARFLPSQKSISLASLFSGSHFSAEMAVISHFLFFDLILPLIFGEL